MESCLGMRPATRERQTIFPRRQWFHPDGRFAVLLHSGFGAYTSGEKQSLTVLNLETNELRDFPDERLEAKAKQAYFLGAGFQREWQAFVCFDGVVDRSTGKREGKHGKWNRGLWF